MSSDYSTLILKYSTKLKKDPSSLVFAPLAEIYIKLGQYDDALRILQDGLKANPHSISGYICLAECYTLKNEHSLAVATLDPLVEKYCENLKLQRLYADACYQVGEYSKALDAYKRILFLNPRDTDIYHLVKKLEDYIGNPVITDDKGLDRKVIAYEDTEQSLEFPVEQLGSEDDLNQWVQMDTTKSRKEVTEKEGGIEQESMMPTVQESSLDSVERVDHVVGTEHDIVEECDSLENSSPIFTRSILNIYMGQKLWVKAQEVANVLLAESEDERERVELEEILSKIELETKSELEKNSSSGDQLMDFFDKNIAQQNQSSSTTKQAKLLKFLEKIKEQAVLNK